METIQDLDRFELQKIFNESNISLEVEDVKVGMLFHVTCNNCAMTMVIRGISLGIDEDNLYTVAFEEKPIVVTRESIILELTFINKTVNDFIQDCVANRNLEFTQETLKKIESIKHDLRELYNEI